MVLYSNSTPLPVYSDIDCIRIKRNPYKKTGSKTCTVSTTIPVILMAFVFSMHLTLFEDAPKFQGGIGPFFYGESVLLFHWISRSGVRYFTIMHVSCDLAIIKVIMQTGLDWRGSCWKR